MAADTTDTEKWTISAPRHTADQGNTACGNPKLTPMQSAVCLGLCIQDGCFEDAMGHAQKLIGDIMALQIQKMAALRISDF